MPRPLLTTCLLLALLTSAVATAKPGPQPEAKILRSRRQVQRALGKAVASGVPEHFDFSLYSLVWLDLGANPDAMPKIVTLPADQPLNHTVSASIGLRLTRTRPAVQVVLWHDAPCSGGIPKPREVMSACLEQASQSAAAAKKTVLLFATPRARLKRVKVEGRRVPPRP